MRLIFFGSGEFGLPTLIHLHEQHEVVAVVSQPDRRAGRKKAWTATAIAEWAQQQDLKVVKCDDANESNMVEQLAHLHSEAAVVIAFGQKLGERLIDVVGDLAINLHGSLLPRYRGAAPINWVIINGEEKTGLSVISLSQRMDAGLIYASMDTPIDPNETAGELHDRLGEMGPKLVAQVLDGHREGKLRGHPQDELQACRAPKLSKLDDGYVSFEQSAREVRCRIHGLTPWPGVCVQWRRLDGTTMPLYLRRVEEISEVTHDAAPGTVLENQLVAVGNGGRAIIPGAGEPPGAIAIREVQLPGGRQMSIDQFLHGHRLAAGDMLSPMNR